MRALVTLALTGTLALAQGAGLSLTHVRATYGLLGPTRADMRLLPGDSLYLDFDVEGVAVAANGKVQYSASLELVDAKGKVVYRQNPENLEAQASLGGKTMPAQAVLNIGLDQPAGDYTLQVVVTDRVSKQSQTLTQKFQVPAAEFGIVQVKATSDTEGTVPAGLLGVGQSLFLNFAAVRFERDKGKGQPHIVFEMRVLDEAGKPTLEKPEVGVIASDVAASDQLVGGQFPVSLNRAGKFTVELKATDKIAGKTATVALPLTVQPRR